MKQARSADGTSLAYETVGEGPALVLVDGAFCGRTFGPARELAERLAPRMRVTFYDRRGRGGSEDTQSYTPEREVEDLKAICRAVGGQPKVFGTSSGAALVLRAAAAGVCESEVVVFEPPFYLDGTHQPTPADFRERIAAHLEAGRRDAAVKLFLRVVGVPGFGVFMMRLFPNIWPKLRAAAHTLPYDFGVMGDTQRGEALPEEWLALLARISGRSKVLVGGKSPDWMRHTCETVAAKVSGASLGVIPGQTHTISAKALAPVLCDEFLGGAHG
ncbi:MAG: alpha/beta hydrolase [Polyangiaceae bacterium]|nr:alpha/beta hydrolase [Polyangiaceae bacterium]